MKFLCGMSPWKTNYHENPQWGSDCHAFIKALVSIMCWSLLQRLQSLCVHVCAHTWEKWAGQVILNAGTKQLHEMWLKVSELSGAPSGPPQGLRIMTNVGFYFGNWENSISWWDPKQIWKVKKMFFFLFHMWDRELRCFTQGLSFYMWFWCVTLGGTRHH